MNTHQSPSLDLIHFPKSAEYFRLDLLFDSGTWHLSPVASREAGSDASRVNQILTRIHREQWPYAYIRNRIRERIQILILHAITGDSVFPSTIVNDILHHTDAIAKIWFSYFAVDFTENFAAIDAKMRLADTEWKIQLIGPDGQRSRLPFLVVYSSDMLVGKIGDALEAILENPLETQDREHINRSISESVRGNFERDARPDLLFQVRSIGSHATFLSDFFRMRLREFTLQTSSTWG